MKNKIISIFVLLFIGIILLLPKSKSAPEHSYKIYTPNDFSDITKNVEKTKSDEQILFIVDLIIL